jgi:hypothetical protein
MVNGPQGTLNEQDLVARHRQAEMNADHTEHDNRGDKDRDLHAVVPSPG